MRAAIQDALCPPETTPRKVRPGQKGLVGEIPSDPEAVQIVKDLLDEATRGCPSGIGFFPGLYRATAVTRWVLNMGPPERNGTGQGSARRSVYDNFVEAIEAHPEAVRLKKAAWWHLVYHQAEGGSWAEPHRHYLGCADPENFVRTCRVAAARMLSQRRLWKVVQRQNDRKAGLVKVDLPEYYYGPC